MHYYIRRWSLSELPTLTRLRKTSLRKVSILTQEEPKTSTFIRQIGRVIVIWINVLFIIRFTEESCGQQLRISIHPQKGAE
jgi:hypothetical protein